MYVSIYEFFNKLYSKKKNNDVDNNALIDMNQVIRKQRILKLIRAYGELWRGHPADPIF
jgi:protoheme ferro-lyase